jgi:hypothetical protein
MPAVTMRKVIGIVLILIAGAYWYTNLMDIDISGLRLPKQIEAPAFWLGYAVATAWCMMPELIRVPGATQVNLLPTAPTPFQQPMTIDGPQRGEPFQMEGVWYCQWEGSFLMWDYANGAWIPAAPPTQRT